MQLKPIRGNVLVAFVVAALSLVVSASYAGSDQKKLLRKPAEKKSVELPTAEFIAEANEQAKVVMDQYFKDCSLQDKQTMKARYDGVAEFYSRYTRQKDPDFWARFPNTESDFVDLGQILVPERLPPKYPFRDAFTACAIAHREFLSSNDAESEQKLSTYQECLDDCYRVIKPPLLARIMTCYKSLKKNNN